MTLEIRIFVNRMEIVGPRDVTVSTPREPYSTQRLLVGNFCAAANCLREGLKKAGAVGPFKRKPTLVIRVMEKNDGGLSEVEERCLLEVGHAAGAGEVSVL